MLEELNAEQEKLMDFVAQEWLDYAFDWNKCGFDEEKAKDAVKWIYDISKIPQPKIIEIVDSPLEAQFLLNALDRDKVRAKVGAKVWDKVRNKVRDKVRDKVLDKVLDKVRAKVGAKVWAKVRAKVWDKVRAKNIEWFEFCGCFFYDFGWVGFYDYFMKIGVLDNTDTDFINYSNLIKNKIWDIIACEDICVIVKAPLKVHFDEKGRLHNEKTYAVEWCDGTGEYFIEDYAFDDELFEKVRDDKISANEIMRLENTEQRRICFRKIGSERILKELNSELISEDKKIYALKNGKKKEVVESVYDVELKDDYDSEGKELKARFVKLFDPSKDEFCILRVDPSSEETKTVLGATASTFIMKKEEYLLEKET